MRTIWFICGILSFALGFIGAFLPFLPTVPLMILAAFCFARSSKRFHDWLLAHPTFGPPIADWRDKGAISIKGKRLATLGVGVAFGLSVFMQLPLYALVLQALVLVGVMTFIWSRPSD